MTLRGLLSDGSPSTTQVGSTVCPCHTQDTRCGSHTSVWLATLDPTVTRDARPDAPADVLTPVLPQLSISPPGIDAEHADVVALKGDVESANVEERTIPDEKAVAGSCEFRPADASSVAWSLSWPDSLAVINEDRSIGVDDMETTNSLEGTVDDLHCNSTSIGDVSPSASGAGCRSDCGSALDPSTRPEGSTLV